MEQVKVGKLIEGEASRDAIHVAIAPVVAGGWLSPGMHVMVDKQGFARPATFGECIGIVDPFLKLGPLPNQKFYLFLYPDTITSLRHEWSHPAFVGAEAPEEESYPGENEDIRACREMSCS